MNIESLLEVDLFLQVRGITPGRAATILPALMGLVSVVIGWIGLARASGSIGSRRIMAIAALVLGLICITLSGLHLANSYRANFGTGSGKAGAIVAMVLGLIGLVLATLTLNRSRR